MKGRIIIITVIIIIIVILLTSKKGISNLSSPNYNKTSSQTSIETPNPTPNAPKTYNFDLSTDLKKELDSVNPQILDSDFE